MSTELKVTCYSGYRVEESPVRFFLGEKKIEIVEIMDRWIAPEYRYFKVKGDDRATYILRYDAKTDNWELTMFDRTGSVDG